ncbi:hypothetical protein K523DRAFT_164267 [Schizophyllum commune Tattone D]|nr:hypothetical protein K523DRAFT_164267 [Schizophyllum commune Tattone D]
MADQKLQALLERASSLASIDRQRSCIVPSAGEILEIESISLQLHDALDTLGNLRGLDYLINRQLAVNRSFTSPVRRLAPEILSHVFIFLASTAVDPYNRSRFIMVTVARVCVAWRMTAWSTPQLWTYICTSVESSPRVVGLDYSARARLAGGLPLHVRQFQYGKGETAQRFLTQLRPFSARWHTLRLSASHMFLTMQQPLDLPILAKASITIEGPAVSRPLRFLENASHLQKLEIDVAVDSYAFDETDDWSPFSYPTVSNFTELESLSVNADSAIMAPRLEWYLRELLHLSPTLVVLELHGGVLSDEPSLTMEPIHMVSLREISLHAATSCKVLEYLIAPLVEMMDIGFTSATEPSVFPALLSFLSRPANNGNRRLARLILDQIAVEDTATLLRCMRHLGELQELRVREMGAFPTVLTKELLDRMCCSEDHPPLLHKLTRLTIKARNFLLLSSMEEELHRMVKSREVPRVSGGLQMAALEYIEVIQGAAAHDGGCC